MDDASLFSPNSTDTHTQLMAATYEALQEHGYADLTVQQIGEEFPKSTSLIYQHYEGKDELLVAFLDYLLEAFESKLNAQTDDDPTEALKRSIDHLLPDSRGTNHREFHRAITALRGHSPYEKNFQQRFAKTDSVLKSHLIEILEEGIDQGEFNAIDPEVVASFIISLTQGALNQWTSTGNSEGLEVIHSELETYLEARLGISIGD